MRSRLALCFPVKEKVSIMNRSQNSKPKRVLAISSGGGHWVQLQRLRPSFEGADIAFATVREAYRSEVGAARFHVVPDSNFSNKLKLLRTAFGVLRILLKERPQVVVSTGAAPGFFGIVLGRLLGAKTVWIDSVANVEELSMCGRHAGRWADLWLTQWEHLARESGPRYAGSVL